MKNIVKKILGVAVFAVALSTTANANFSNKVSNNILNKTEKKRDQIFKAVDYQSNPLGKNLNAGKAAKKETFEHIVKACGATVSYSTEDVYTGANKTIDLWSFVINANDYIERYVKSNNKKRIAQYFIFVTKPKEDFMDLYNKTEWVKNKDDKTKHYLYMQTILKDIYVDLRTPYEPMGVAYSYVCENNYLTDEEIGMSSKVFEDFIYKMSVRDFRGVDKLLEAVNEGQYIRSLAFFYN